MLEIAQWNKKEFTWNKMNLRILAYRSYSEKIDKKIIKLDKFQITPFFNSTPLKRRLKKTKSHDELL